jgi:hypothetical protein
MDDRTGGGYIQSTGGSGAVIQAVAGVAAASTSVASAAATISDSGKKTTQATQQASAMAASGNANVVERLASIENLLRQNFSGQARQWAAAAAKIRK